MKKIEFTQKQSDEIILDYTVNDQSLKQIGDRFGVSREAIKRVLLDNNVELKPAQKKFKGGKAAAQKKYQDSHKEMYSEYHSQWQKENREYLNQYQNERKKKLKNEEN